MKTVLSAGCGSLSPAYALSLPYELKDGCYVIIRWKSPACGKRISFNFGEGPDGNNKILFHYNPRFDENLVVRNTKDCNWGGEERDGCMPFCPETTYELKIVVTSCQYECIVNGLKHVNYQHRLPIATAKYFFIHGEGEIYNVTFGEEGAGEAVPCKKDLSMPYNKTLDFYPGKKIYISGAPTSKCGKFTVWLKACADIAFVMDVRMNEQVVVLNTRTGGSWQCEERPEEFPFEMCEFFNIRIEADNDKFRVYVNDMLFAEYKHRMLPLSKINGLAISGVLDPRRVDVC